MVSQIGPQVELNRYEGDPPTRRGSASGYVIGEHRFIITSGYIVRTSDGKPPPIIKARLMGADQELECAINWVPRDENDPSIALLELVDPKPEPTATVPAVRIGKLVGDGQLPCRVTGFLENYYTAETDLEDFRGFILPRGHAKTKTLAVTVVNPPQMVDKPISPWMGFAGAAVLCRGAIVGVVTEQDPRFGLSRLVAVPLTRILETPTLGAMVKAVALSEIETIESHEEDFDPSVIRNVAEADPTNIQQVAASQLALNNSYYSNVLAQAQRSFTAAIVSAAVGLVFFLTAVGIALSTTNFSAAVISAIGGGIVETISGLNFWLYSRTSEQLDSFHLRLERMQRYLVANSVSLSLQEPQRSKSMKRLVQVISGEVAHVQSGRNRLPKFKNQDQGAKESDAGEQSGPPGPGLSPM